MRRRTLLAAAAGAVIRPAGLQAQAMRVLRFVAGGDPGGLDPVAEPRKAVAEAALLVFDTLYGVDSRLEPQPQMCESHSASEDLSTWTFVLRPGLRFHDDAPVGARDAVASLHRWMARDRMGSAIRDRLDALEVLDDRTFRFRLHAPFRPMLYALGKPAPPLAVVMPERLARTDPAQPVPQIIGSGPMRLRPAEGGARATFERVGDYAARAEGADWLAGGKRVLFERIDWILQPDPAEAAEALQNGGADWWDAPSPDMVPLLKRSRNVTVDVVDPLGGVGALRLNHRAPPFADLRVRRVLLASLSQAACMTALTGGDDALWKPMPGVYTPGTPAAAQAAAVRPPPAPAADLDAARRTLADLGAAGAPVAVLAADIEGFARAQAVAVAALLQRLGFAPSVVALPEPALAARLAQPDAWQCFATWYDGAEMATPAAAALDAGGDAIGWPRSEAVQNAVAAWYAAPDAAAAAAASAAVNAATLDNVSFVPTGFFQRYQAWRVDVSGIAKSPLPLFWGVQKT